VVEPGYQGVDNLEILDGAVRYNRFLVDRIIAAGRGTPTAVDFGAGMGTIAAAVAARGVEVLCVEPDAGLRRTLGARGLRAAADVEAIPAGSRDFVYTINVLEHIEDDAAALGAIGSRLRSGGRLFVYVPAFQVLYSSMDRKVGHHRRYSRARLRALATGAGFEIESLRYADSLGFLATLAYKAIGSRSGDLSPAAVGFFDRVVFPCSRVLDRLGCEGLFGKNLCAVLRRP